jgi:hypothetical protein
MTICAKTTSDTFAAVLQVIPTIGTLYLINEHLYLTQLLRQYDTTQTNIADRIIDKIMSHYGWFPEELADTELNVRLVFN